MSNTQRYRDALKWLNFNAISDNINRSGDSRLHRVVVNAPAAGTVTVYDGPTVGSDVVAAIDSSNAGSFDFNDLLLKNGLTVSGSGAADVTVVYE